jgi:5-hydroxyisourate hydrolase
MSRITTHVLDTVLGKPAAGITVSLDKRAGEKWNRLSSGETDADGRCADLAPDAPDGIYRLTFDTGAYFARGARKSIYPEIAISFACNGEAHYHLPLLLSDNSYTTYRGS